jgi:hypothetical protein
VLLIDTCRRLRRSPLLSLALVAFLALAPLPLAAASSPVQPADVPNIRPPASVRASAGTTGTIAVVRWRASTGAVAYRVWRSGQQLVGFEPIGSSQATSFADASGVPGRTYFYQVTALLPSGDESRPSTSSHSVSADWNESPHTTYSKGNLCLICHSLHRGDDSGDAVPSGGEVALCESCHDGQGARSNVKDGAVDSFTLASGHRVEEATRSADLTNECSSCHSPHADPRKRSGLYRKRIEGSAVTGGNTWCAACHDDKSSWSPRYPALGAPVRNASGYPVLGTYPGPKVYASTSASGHAGIDAGAGRPKGDCLLCHAAHRGPNAYDGLLLTFAPPTTSTVATDQAQGRYAQLCLGCHGGQSVWVTKGATDIERYVTRRDAGAYAGHSVVTSGGTLPVGAPIPCYDCHNPHGSSRGNSAMISDALGRGLSTDSASGVRAFCLTCHSTSDGLVWDSVAGTYAAAGDAMVEGLRRDGTGGNVLRLPDAAKAAHASSAGDSCYDCHGGDEVGATGYNAHAPQRTGTAAATVKPSGSAPTTQEKTTTAAPVRAQQD